MKIYYYHTRPVTPALEEWKEHLHPGHILYGLPLLPRNGVECILHTYRPSKSRLGLICRTTFDILRCREPYQVLYGTSFLGLELIILLRALGLYRKPIAIWHHTAVRTSGSSWKERLSRFFYKGIDRMFLFSRKLIADSVATGKVDADKLQLIHWGPDLAFYDHLLADMPPLRRSGFISTGKENRDVDTLLQAFCATTEELDLYIAPANGPMNYRQTIEGFCLPDSVRVHYTEGIIPHLLAQRVAQKQCIVICCLDFPYTVGLTTLVEAFALGIPVICSRNPNFEIDIDREGVGITVAYGDTKGWIEAIHYIASHPEEARRMGKNARRLAEERFNLELFSHEIAESLRNLSNDSPKKRNFA